MNDIRPFRFRAPQTALDDLGFRLANTRWPDELPGVGWDYGIPLARVRALADRWLEFDWPAREEAFDGFVTQIDGQNVHFLHIRSTDPDALPLILTHGWPGSTAEFLDLIPLLRDRFHLVIPAIPGFGFSGPTTTTGWGQERVAAAWAILMERLGYHRYGAHGGDWGSGISRLLARTAPGRVIGVHLNYLPTPGAPDGLSDDDRARLDRTMKLGRERHPHQWQFRAAPQTLAYALTDSPTGLLAFLAEKFTIWADPAAPIPDDTILTDVMLYWLTGTAGSAARIVKESGFGGPIDCPSPLAVAVLPHDIVQSVRPLAERTNDIRQWTEFPRGGHFAALEVPDLLAADITKFFASVE
jgi:pimeloyl-ACP methyl ester carboxylesterase